MPEEQKQFRSTISITRSAVPTTVLAEWVARCEEQATDLYYTKEYSSKEAMLDPLKHGTDGRTYHAFGIVKTNAD